MKKLTKYQYDLIKSLLYNFRYGKTQWMGYHCTWHIDWWDGRTKSVRELKSFGFDRKEVAQILRKIVNRSIQKEKPNNENLTKDQRISFIKIANQCTFDLTANSSRYNCTGIDWKAFHRPASSGGWVLIAPDEPGNNWHTTDNIIVKYMTKKYLAN